MQDTFSDSEKLVVVPDLGAEGRSITLVNWLVSPGQRLIVGERIAELLVDSCLFHLESDIEGQLVKFLIPSGAGVEPGTAVASVDIRNRRS